MNKLIWALRVFIVSLLLLHCFFIWKVGDWEHAGAMFVEVVFWIVFELNMRVFKTML